MKVVGLGTTSTDAGSGTTSTIAGAWLELTGLQAVFLQYLNDITCAPFSTFFVRLQQQFPESAGMRVVADPVGIQVLPTAKSVFAIGVQTRLDEDEQAVVSFVPGPQADWHPVQLLPFL